MNRHTTILVTGIVQGIGFRPFCSRLAEKMGLGGSVRNTPEGVKIEIYGPGESVDSFLELLVSQCPPLGHIQSVSIVSDLEKAEGKPGPFSILESEDGEESLVVIPPDIATCGDCLREMKDPGNRRFRYPFINCTNCGPRFTIIRGLPYDRPMTTMETFPMCGDCHREYVDHGDRRFHAQPTACEVCGPSLSLLDASGKVLLSGEEALDGCVASLARGEIAAVKGLGGFHVACLADNAPLARLRSRKKRPHKPLALMAKDMETAERIVRLSPSSRLMLNSPRRPIVVCPKRTESTVSGLVAPGHDSIGVMLPYTPLHHLLMEKIPVLVMTSANLSDAPIVSDNREALDSLGGIVDVFLTHNRDICMKIDDSVIAPAGKRPIMLRRGRGFVPHPVIVKRDMPQILAAGAEMKSTFAITRDKMIFVSQYLGDLKQMGTAVYYEKTLRHFISLFGFRPRLMAIDMHPSYPCADIARKVIGEPEDVLEVQHHHAHMAACMAEHNSFDPAIGIIMDGTGLGTDRKTWGGEFLVGDPLSFVRAGHFREAPLPGGDRSVMEPWRFALGLLADAFGKEKAFPLAEGFWPNRRDLFDAVAAAMELAPLTTSCGRLFDAVSALLGIRDAVSYDGQAAMELESIAMGAKETAPFDIIREDGMLLLDWRPAIRWIAEEGILLGQQKASAAFHLGLAKTVSDIAMEISDRTGLKRAVLSGGVWQNRRFSSLVKALLKRNGMEPMVHLSLSPNDECISVGQAVIGAWHWDPEKK